MLNSSVLQYLCTCAHWREWGTAFRSLQTVTDSECSWNRLCGESVKLVGVLSLMRWNGSVKGPESVTPEAA